MSTWNLKSTVELPRESCRKGQQFCCTSVLAGAEEEFQSQRGQMSALENPRPAVSGSARALLTNAIDYAGLFPPSALSMTEAVSNFGRYWNCVESWMLGKFVVAASRLRELESALIEVQNVASPWQVSALVSMASADRELSHIVAFNDRNRDRAVVDSLEFKCSTNAELDYIAEHVPFGFSAYCEVSDPAVFVPLLVSAGLRAKVRMGGITSDLFPSPAAVAEFLALCSTANVPFKATAGLHHAIRSVHPLTYAADSPRWLMHGFLNVLLAAALAKSEASRRDVIDVLETETVDAFHFDDQKIAWRHWSFQNEQLSKLRMGFASSFGSCSFGEPVRELCAMSLI